ncbi:phosphate ABC transporter substrate-binding protein PstS [Reyranella sp.]|uniref:phosphate ABC transporter substrate-binding protein PstS n=1 Tax=Reyranella sp. TaxID=1929291 RepID=UPI003D0B6EBA
MVFAASLFRMVVAAILVPLLAGVAPAVAQDITGAGSTFVYPVMAKWSAAYSSRGQGKVLYHPIGSGAGIAQIKSGALDFAASDAPLKPEELAHAGLEQFPLVIGGIVPVVNIAGIKAGDLKLTGGILADIYLGKVRRWNDPAIGTLNPGLALPDAAIMVVHRLDSSGTTFNWAYYLSKASDEWRSKAGWGTNISWVVGVGGKGNSGLAALVAQIPNSIGYVEYAYALQKELTYAVVRNKAGNFIAPNAASFQAAAMSANWAGARNFHLMLADAPGENAYPIAATVFVLLRRESAVPARRTAALSFLQWVLHDGKAIASDLNYVPLPAALVSCIEKGTCDGTPLTSVSSSQ